MRDLRAIALATAAIGLVVVVGTASAVTPKPKTVPFKGTYLGKVTEKLDGTNVTAMAVGAGVGTPIGKGKLTGIVSATTANPPCSPLGGTGSITGPKGNLALALGPTSRGCAASEDDQNNISVTGTAKVTGGTLQFRKAKGSIHFSGHYDRAGGAFTVTFTGSVTY
jgi:hypothetical protein